MTCPEELLHFNTMPVGLCDAIHTFQRLRDMILGKLCWESTPVYSDDVNIYSKSFHITLEKNWASQGPLQSEKLNLFLCLYL